MHTNAPAGAGPVDQLVRPGAEALPLVERLRRWPNLPGLALDSDLMHEAADEIERLRAALLEYFLAADAAWVELCVEAQKQGIRSMPILPGQAKSLEQYNKLRQVFGA